MIYSLLSLTIGSVPVSADGAGHGNGNWRHYISNVCYLGNNIHWRIHSGLFVKGIKSMTSDEMKLLLEAYTKHQTNGSWPFYDVLCESCRARFGSHSGGGLHCLSPGGTRFADTVFVPPTNLTIPSDFIYPIDLLGKSYSIKKGDATTSIGKSAPPINDYICPACKNDKCSRSEKSCWRCGNLL